MRFARAYYRAGACIAVAEKETPFSTPAIPDADQEVELGLIEDFDPQGRPPSRRLFESVVAALPLPAASIDCPTSVEGIKQRLRERGPAGIPERAAHWLEFMGTFTPEEMDAAGLPRLTLTRAIEFDTMRKARDPTVGSRADSIKAEARRRIAERAAAKATSTLPAPESGSQPGLAGSAGQPGGSK